MISDSVSVSNLGRCLQLYLLVQLQLTPLAEQLSGQSGKLSNCSTDEHWSGSLCCKNCSAGEFVQEPCTISHTLGQCEKCPPETFTEASNGLDSCRSCSRCGDDQEIVAECSATSDRKCQCKTGLFYSDSGSSEFCHLCTKCPQGVPVLHKCNSTSNTVCDLAATNHRNRPYLLIVLILLGIAVLWYYYLQKERPFRRHCCIQFSGGVSPWRRVTG